MTAVVQPAGPLREVVYIFEREGDRGGGIWHLVLACGHAVARPQHAPPLVRALFEPIARRLAPKRVRCHYCESGLAELDPWITIEAFGGPSR